MIVKRRRKAKKSLICLASRRVAPRSRTEGRRKGENWHARGGKRARRTENFRTERKEKAAPGHTPGEKRGGEITDSSSLEGFQKCRTSSETREESRLTRLQKENRPG